ncbi:metallophosphoesterase family protein [Bradyrhizobium sp. STM 3562]|uniref:metallophosphoesterase family protein n=1 Tax=Bradyrhizobium sp. STM 3562 TaxID=578924 RepID=UPI003890134D
MAAAMSYPGSDDVGWSIWSYSSVFGAPDSLDLSSSRMHRPFRTKGTKQMTKKVIAHFTDAHLGQKLVIGGEIAGDKMRYDGEPEEHETNLRLVLDHIAQNGISELIFGGDIGARERLATFFELLGAYDFTASLILGNHDVYADVAEYRSEGARAVGGKMCYSRDDGCLRYVFLDTSDNTVGGEQLAWLERELTGASKVALFLHHPILDIDTPVERAGAILRDRDELKMILTRTRCDISAFCGHYHMEDEASEANIRQFVTPAVSYQIVKRAERIEVDTRASGYRILEIDGGEIKTEVVMLSTAGQQRASANEQEHPE